MLTVSQRDLRLAVNANPQQTAKLIDLRRAADLSSIRTRFNPLRVGKA